MLRPSGCSSRWNCLTGGIRGKLARRADSYLERVIKLNLAKASRILRILHFHAHDLKLKPSMTVYRRKTASGKFLLRFSKSGEKNIEEAYARYFVKLGKI